jgi:hypothetical protein
MPYSSMLRCVAPVRTDVSEKHIVSIARVTRIGELGTMLTVISNRSNVHLLLVTAVYSTASLRANADIGLKSCPLKSTL